MGSAAGITFLQQDQHEALGKAPSNEGKRLDGKTLGTGESLYKDVEFGGQLCLQVGIPLKPFCPSKVPCLARVLRFAASLAC